MNQPSVPATQLNKPKKFAAIRGVTGSQRYGHIDALRAFAVMLVVVAHTNIGGIPGGSGVTLFFTISGFVITHILLRERKKSGSFSLSGFYWRRFLKIAPPFVLIIGIPTLIYSVWFPISWPSFATQVFFVFNWADAIGISPVVILPGSSVLWSLAVEEQFYIVFALLWLFFVKSKHYVNILIGLGAVGAIFSLALRIGYVMNGVSSERIYGGTDTRLDAIALGILAAAVFTRINRPSFAVARRCLSHDLVPFIALSAYLASLLIRDEIFRDTIRYSIQSLAAAAFILYGLIPAETRFRGIFNRVTTTKAIQLIGLASYSMYLIHNPLYRLLTPAMADWPEYLRASALVLVGVGAGILAWMLIERPVERWKHERNSVNAVRLREPDGLQLPVQATK